VSLADRMVSKHIRFACYVSAFANHRGGHIYYGVKDDGSVEGEIFGQNDEEVRCFDYCFIISI
jgi:predicted HTH transcriptional regulator